jgi:hypothetical protein
MPSLLATPLRRGFTIRKLIIIFIVIAIFSPAPALSAGECLPASESGIFTLISAVVLARSRMRAEENLPLTDPGDLWSYITKTDPYRGWGLWTGYEGMYRGKSPHGSYIKLYGNPIALKAPREGNPMPNGAIIVKENYGADQKTLMAITTMYKVNGYNAEAGDWFWVKYASNGNVFKSGKIEECINCHRTQEAKGWLFTAPK